MRWDDNQRKTHSERMKGKNNPNYGKHQPPEICEKMGIVHIGNKYWVGRHHTEETKIKLRNFRHSEETKAKLSAMKKGKPIDPAHRAKILAGVRRGVDHPKYGKPTSAETRAKQSAAKMGELGPNWQGGISFEPYCPKFNEDLRRRIRTYFENRCVFCGKTKEENGKNLSCHHVTYNKEMCCDGKPVQFATLCNRCHSRTNKDRARWEAITHFLIEEVYRGRSYFTKEEWRCINETSHE